MPTLRVANPAYWRTFTATNAYWAGAVCAFAYLRSGVFDAQLVASYGGEIDRVSPVPGTEDLSIFRIRYPDIDFIGIEGTTNQWLSYLTGHGYTSVESIIPGGQTYSYFGLQKDFAMGVIQGWGNDRKPTVLCGHSLGGAVASLCGFYLNRLGWDILSVWTLGSPMPVNDSFRRVYSILNFRMTANNDIVPAVPPPVPSYAAGALGILFLPDPMVHVGTHVSITGTDDSFTKEDSFIAASELAFRHNPTPVISHFMGSYMQGLYSGLSNFAKDDYYHLFEILRASGSHGVPDELRRPNLAAEYEQRIVQAGIAETAELAISTGAVSPYRIRLYTAPGGPVPEPEAVTFTEASFPGYASQPPPAGMTTFPSDRDGTHTDHGEFAFKVTDDLEEPVAIWGMYVTTASGGGVKVVKVTPFQRPIIFSGIGDRIDGVIAFAVSQIA